MVMLEQLAIVSFIVAKKKNRKKKGCCNVYVRYIRFFFCVVSVAILFEKIGEFHLLLDIYFLCHLNEKKSCFSMRTSK